MGKLQVNGDIGFTGAITTPGNDTVVIKPAQNNYDQIGASNCKFWKVHATTFYGNLSGNADTATKLSTARTISLTGSVTGSGSFDGSGNLSIATTTNHTHDNLYVNASGDTMSGRLTLNVYDNSVYPSQQSLVINGVDTTDVGLCPGISMHIPNKTYGSLKMYADGSWRFYNHACNGYMPVYASTFYGALSGNATSADYANYIIGKVQETDITVHNAVEGAWTFTSAYSADSAGLFPTSNNANAILTINRHQGYYDSQLGFSSNGCIYYRNFNAKQQDTSTGWSQIAFTSSNVASANYATTAGSAGSAGGINSVSPVLAVAGESNTLQAINNYDYYTNDTPIKHSLLGMIKALDFQWYTSHWRIGNLRSGATASSGFGFAFSENNSTWNLRAFVGVDGFLWANKLGSYNYGSSLPGSGQKGEIFFKT